MSILEEFAYGNINLMNQTFRRGSAYGQALEAVIDGEKKLLALLSGAEKTRFETYIEMQGELSSLAAVKNLICGYKLGVLMTAEAFVTGGDLVGGQGEG